MEVKQPLAVHGVFHVLAFAKTSRKMPRFCGCSERMQPENLGSSPAHKGQPRMSPACKTVQTSWQWRCRIPSNKLKSLCQIQSRNVDYRWQKQCYLYLSLYTLNKPTCLNFLKKFRLWKHDVKLKNHLLWLLNILSVPSGAWNPLPEEKKKKDREVKTHFSYVLENTFQLNFML